MGASISTCFPHRRRVGATGSGPKPAEERAAVFATWRWRRSHRSEKASDTESLFPSERAAAGATRSSSQKPTAAGETRIRVVGVPMTWTRSAPLPFPSTVVFSRSDRKPAVTTTGRPALWEYDVREMVSATGGFRHTSRLGQGGTGVVFRGTLLGHDGVLVDVAVKRFYDPLTEPDGALIREDLRGRHFLQHRNVVRLHGYCVDQSFCLVYDYMPKGSLSHHLFDGEGNPATLSWARRSNIIRGAAQGLLHFHRHGAVHGCVKASNILIDKDFTARLGDFGFPSRSPKLGGNSNREMEMEMDVFHLGTVILEVVSGRRFRGGNPNLPGSWVDSIRALHGRGCSILAAVDATLGIAEGGDLNRDEAEKMLLVGLACSHPYPNQRPKIGDVVDILNSESRMLPPEVPPLKSRPLFGQW